MDDRIRRLDQLYDLYLDAALDAGGETELLAALDEPALRCRWRTLAALDGKLLEECAAAAANIRRESWRERIRPWRAAAGLAAAVAAIVLLGVPHMQTERGAARAEEAIEQAGRAFVRAKGLAVEFSATFTNDRGGERPETRTATGSIHIGPIDDEIVHFRSAEKWAASGDDAAFTRKRVQSDTVWWVCEDQGHSMLYTHTGQPSPFNGDMSSEKSILDASPMDVRDRRAVEGLAALVRSFARDRHLAWMGCKWALRGGKGSAAEPWEYRHEPNGGLKEDAAVGDILPDRVVWTMRLSTAASGLIDKIELREEVLDASTGKLRSSIATTYTIQTRDAAWPASDFEPDEAPADPFIVPQEMETELPDDPA